MLRLYRSLENQSIKSRVLVDILNCEGNQARSLVCLVAFFFTSRSSIR